MHGSLSDPARAFDNLPATERAAALMHLVYYATIDRPDVDWSSTLPKNWVDLDDRARAFNLAILDTWAQNPDLLEQWITTLRGLAREQAAKRRPKVKKVKQVPRSG